MDQPYHIHNYFRESLAAFIEKDPQLSALSQLKYQYSPKWWTALTPGLPGIYIVTGGRQIGKSTSCKLLIKYCLEHKMFSANDIFYLPCDEIFDAKSLSQSIRNFLEQVGDNRFLLIIDEVTFVENWDRVIKAIADEGWFRQGLCIITGSDTLVLKEAAMRFPGRRGNADQTDFHLYPLSFREYVELLNEHKALDESQLNRYFQEYLICGGYLRAINDYAETGKVRSATFQTYEQWIRGDFLRKGKKESYLLALLDALMRIGVSHISYSSLTHRIGMMSKETCIDYCHLLERMDVLFSMQAYDQNRKQGFPRKDRKFHFLDPFIYNTIYRWLQQEGYLGELNYQASVVEACVASHCHQSGKVYYFKGKGEIDVIWLKKQQVQAIEVKWTNQLRPSDLDMLKQFKYSMIVTKQQTGEQEGIKAIPIYQFLYGLGLGG